MAVLCSHPYVNMMCIILGGYNNLFKYILQSSKYFNKVKPIMAGKKTKSVLKSVEEVIGALGSRANAARFLRVSESQICNILKDGKIPGGHQIPLMIYLNHKGYEIDISKVFGVTLDSILDRIEENQVSR